MPDLNIKILLVDDSEMQFYVVRDYVELAAINNVTYEVVWSATYEEGFQLLQTEDYDVCLIDYELGDRNGLEFIEDAIQLEIAVPMIFLTGHGSYEVDIQAMRAGAVDFLDKKSLRPNTLERSIRYALANQQMLEQERKQRVLSEALLDIALALNSSLEIDEVLERILTNAGRVIPHSRANIMMIENGKAYVRRHRGYSLEQQNIMNTLVLDLKRTPNLSTMYQSRQPILISNTSEYSNWRRVSELEDIQSYLGVPIIIHDEVIGFLGFDGVNIDEFNDEHAHYSLLFATQAAQAIRNTRSYQQAQELAAAQERQRLARDLHDAVSQTLFSASVIAQTLPRLLDHSIEEVHNGLADLNRLNRGALAEMRTLLVELRPQALIETDLPTLLRNLANAFKSRNHADVQLRISSTHVLPEDVHVVFYRIAQEALNNIMKYANPKEVMIELIHTNSHLILTVEDDGIGFDIANVPTGHLGLKIMAERVEAINGELSISSDIGIGTRVQLVWHINHEGEENE